MKQKDSISGIIPMDLGSNIGLLSKISLFQGIDQKDLGSMLACLQAKKKTFLKNETILRAGEVISHLGIILSGRGQIIREDIMGNRNILSNLEVGDMFAEAFACAESQRLPFQVVAITDCTVMFLDYRRIVTTCSSSCYFHTSLIQNMMKILAVGYIAMAVTQSLSGVMRGAGDTMTPMWISIVTTVFIRVPLAYGIAHFTKTPELPGGRYECIWVSLLISWVLGAVLTVVFYRIGKWKNKGLE